MVFVENEKMNREGGDKGSKQNKWEKKVSFCSELKKKFLVHGNMFHVSNVMDWVLFYNVKVLENVWLLSFVRKEIRMLNVGFPFVITLHVTRN